MTIFRCCSTGQHSNINSMGWQLHGSHTHSHGGVSAQPHGQNHKHQENINVRAAFIHVLGDVLQSIGVFCAAIVIYFKPNWQLADPICTFIFSVIVLCTTITIMKDAITVRKTRYICLCLCITSSFLFDGKRVHEMCTHEMCVNVFLIWLLIIFAVHDYNMRSFWIWRNPKPSKEIQLIRLQHFWLLIFFFLLLFLILFIALGINGRYTEFSWLHRHNGSIHASWWCRSCS